MATSDLTSPSGPPKPPTPPSPASPVVPAAPTAPAAGAAGLNKNLNDLQERLTKLAQEGGCYADIESLIATARAQLANQKMEDAQGTYDKAAAAVCRAEASAKATPLAWTLLWVEASYLAVILALGYFVKRYPGYGLWAGLVGLGAKAAWFGSVGGVTIGIYGLYTHISAKDFDPTFRLWYICKPVMGAIFGWFVFLVYYVGVVSAQAGEKVDIKSPELSYLIAFLAGFSERFTIKTIDKFMTVLTAGDDKNKDKNKGQAGGSPSSAQP
jgi:hypothetical protein